MATITYYLKGKQKQKEIHVRLSMGRKGGQHRCDTFETIAEDYWDTKSKFPKKKNAHNKNLAVRLGNLRTHLEEACNKMEAKGESIDLKWVKNEIRCFNGGVADDDKSLLLHVFDDYIKSLEHKVHNTALVTKATKTKYKTVRKKLDAFQKYTKKSYQVKDVDINFRAVFIEYLTDVQLIAKTTAGKYLITVKTVCNHAKLQNIEFSPQLQSLKGIDVKQKHIHFSFDDIKKLEDLTLDSEALDNARDWLVLGCHLGQRVIDLLSLNINNISTLQSNNVILLSQTKTKSPVAIPIYPAIQKILDKHDGNFPRKISAAKFNKHIKKVAEKAGFNQPTKGSILKAIEINGKSEQRKKDGIFPKYELVTSHICRRSFATNYYGKMSTSLIISVTGHKTESEYLKYVGKESIDHVSEVSKAFNQVFEQEQNKRKYSDANY